MIISVNVDPTLYINATPPTFSTALQNGGACILINESSCNLIIIWGNGDKTYVPANDRRRYDFSQSFQQPNPNIIMQIDSVIGNYNSNNKFVVETYDPGEPVPETYPASLYRQANTGMTGQMSNSGTADNPSWSQINLQPYQVLTQISTWPQTGTIKCSRVLGFDFSLSGNGTATASNFVVQFSGLWFPGQNFEWIFQSPANSAAVQPTQIRFPYPLAACNPTTPVNKGNIFQIQQFTWTVSEISAGSNSKVDMIIWVSYLG